MERKARKGSNILLSEFEKFKDQAETLLIRAIVPRDTIKDLESVLAKMKRNLPSQSCYSLHDLEDLIGLKILCPYSADAKLVIEWMRSHEGFLVSPESDEKARREKKSGYRGYHYTIELRGPLLMNNEDLSGIKCEVQVKTMLEEAWDAKTHDVIYKREERINSALLKKMRLVSDQFAVLDEWSETLRDLILQQEIRERERKVAVAKMYLQESNPLFQEILSKLPQSSELQELREETFTPKNVLRLLPEIQQYRRDGNLSQNLCLLAGLVGLYARGKHIDVWALDVCDDLVRRAREDPLPYLTKGSICWAFDRFDEAIDLTETCIEKAESQDHIVAVAEGRGNFAYWVADKA